MATKLIVLALAIVTVVSANDNSQGGPDFAEYFNKFQEQLKPIFGNFPQFPGNLGSGNFPSFGNLGASSGNTPTKRQAPNTIDQWFSQFGQFGQGNNPFPGNFPFKPENFIGNLPFVGNNGVSSQNES